MNHFKVRYAVVESLIHIDMLKQTPEMNHPPQWNLQNNQNMINSISIKYRKYSL